MSYIIGKDSYVTIDGGLVPQVVSIAGPNIHMDVVETTPISDIFKIYKPAVYEGATATISILWDPKQHSSLWSKFTTQKRQYGEPNDVQVVFYYRWIDTSISRTVFQSKKISFDAFITDFPVSDSTVDSAVTIDIQLQVTGDVIVT